MAAIGTLPVVLGVGDHASRPAASAVGVGGLYSCTDHSLVYQTDGSSWTTWASLAGTGAVATDAIWDAAGDLALGTGANTAARLAIGSNTHVLTSNGTTATWAAPAAATFVGVLANRTTDQTIATGGAVVSFNAADTYDTNTFHDPGGANPSRLIVPSGQDGKYVITAYLIWSGAAYGAGTIKQARIYLNGAGTGWAQTAEGNNANFIQQVVTTPPLDLVATNYIELYAFHDRGTDGTVSGATAAIKLGMYKVG